MSRMTPGSMMLIPRHLILHDKLPTLRHLILLVKLPTLRHLILHDKLQQKSDTNILPLQYSVEGPD